MAKVAFDIEWDIDWKSLLDEAEETWKSSVKKKKKKWESLSQSEIDKLRESLRKSLDNTIFAAAGKRWKSVIDGWLPDSKFKGPLLIRVRFEKLVRPEGRPNTAALVRPSSLVPMDRGPLPKEGTITIDLDDRKDLLDRRAEFLDVITHEIGHVLGIGTLFEGAKGSLVDKDKKLFLGEKALKQYLKLAPGEKVEGVPVTFQDIEQDRDAFHWNDDPLKWELMSATLDAPTLGGAPGTGLNAISTVTIGALEDLGYIVNEENAELFALPRGDAVYPLSPRVGRSAYSHCSGCAMNN